MIKEISMTKYGYDKQLIPTFSPYEIYQYSNSMLPKKSVDIIKKAMVYSNKPVYYNRTMIERR